MLTPGKSLCPLVFVAHNHKKKAELQGTRLYAVFGGHEYEYALKGYDIEIKKASTV